MFMKSWGFCAPGLSETSKILGPTPKPIARTRNLYHYQILIKYRLEMTGQLSIGFWPPKLKNEIVSFKSQ